MKHLISLLSFLFYTSVLYSAPFTDHGNGTVTDTKTRLMWQQSTASGSYTWEVALTYCETLSLAGYTDWRLPNRRELFSIVDFSASTPSINATAFPGTVSSYYWSSTSRASSTTLAWYVRFDYGLVNAYYKTSTYYVRCVRGG